jgi:hypothetical protein
MNIEVKILRNEQQKPAGKLADAEIHFIGGELAGLKLGGFAVWERREGTGRSVSFPQRAGCLWCKTAQGRAGRQAGSSQVAEDPSPTSSGGVRFIPVNRAATSLD